MLPDNLLFLGLVLVLIGVPAIIIIGVSMVRNIIKYKHKRKEEVAQKLMGFERCEHCMCLGNFVIIKEDDCRFCNGRGYRPIDRIKGGD